MANCLVFYHDPEEETTEHISLTLHLADVLWLPQDSFWVQIDLAANPLSQTLSAACKDSSGLQALFPS